MLVVLEQYKLHTPDADIKTMPQALRKEVRNFVRNYVGRYSNELTTVKKLKKTAFLNKHYSELRFEILNDSKIKSLIADFNDKYIKFKEVYVIVEKNNSLNINNNIYDLTTIRKTTVDVSDSWVNEQVTNEFNKLYGAGFIEFADILSKFEKKIEEAVIFATITEVYKLIAEYAKFDPYLKKLSDLKIK